MAKDYYADLGVSKSASQEEIKQAYKRLAKQFHPDVNKESDAEEKFKRINEAYKVLSDPQKRQNFDQFGDAAERFGGFGGFQGFSGFSGEDFDFSSIFEDMGFGSAFSEMFGRGFAQGARTRRGQDIAVNLAISFEEAVFGTNKEFSIDRFETCEKCSGKGTTEKDGKTKCTNCNGSGVEQSIKKTFLGTIATRQTCRKCKGEGSVITKPCSKCSGIGREKKKTKISVKIPSGVHSGSRLRLHKQGNAGEENAETGDLFVILFVEPHKFFKRDDDDIFLEIPISFTEAALGAKIEVPTINGTVELKIPSGTQSGTLFKLRGLGVKSAASGRTGDEFVKVHVDTPKSLSKKQKELLEQMAKEDGKNLRKDLFS